MTRYGAAFLAIAFLLAAAACGTTRPAQIPDVTNQRLDVAEDTLDSVGLRYETAGGGAFGIVVRSHWCVYRQSPEPGAVATSVTLFVARCCCRPGYPEIDS